MPMIDPAVEAYAERHTTAAPPELSSLMERAKEELPRPAMVSGGVVGRLLKTLVFATRAQLVLEIGTYAGTSALWMAQALAAGGRSSPATSTSSGPHSRAPRGPRRPAATTRRARMRPTA